MDSLQLWKQYDRCRGETVACNERWAALLQHLDESHPLVSEAQRNWNKAIDAEVNSFSAWIRSDPELAAAMDHWYESYRKAGNSADELAAQAQVDELIASRETEYRTLLWTAWMYSMPLY